MDNELEKMLEEVSVRVEGSRGESLGLQKLKGFKVLKNLILFEDKNFRLKLVKIAGLAVAIIITWVIVAGGENGPLEIKKASAVKPNDKLLESVAKLIILPDERPIVATIVDLKPLRDNPFFKGAKEGDKLLIFENFNRAILYDIDANILLNIGTPQQTGIIYE